VNEREKPNLMIKISCHNTYITINKAVFFGRFMAHPADTDQGQMIKIRVIPYSLVASLISLAISKHPDNYSCA